MNDWKGVLRELKKGLTSTKKKDGRCRHGDADTKSKIVGEIESNWLKAEKDRAKLRSPETPAGKPQRPVPQPNSASRVQANVVKPALAPTANASSSSGKDHPQKLPGVPGALNRLHRGELTRRSFYKSPEPWVMAGGRTQYSSSRSGRPVEIVIGLDFGTSYTKTAVGLMDQILPVSWEGVSAIPNSYLLPTEYSELEDGSCQFGQAPNVSFERVHQRLKQPFIDPAVSTLSIAKAAVFLALVLRYVRAWIYHHHGSKIGSSQIRWLLNIGTPSNGLETERLETAYRKLGSLAWSLSLTEADIKLTTAQQEISNWKSIIEQVDLIDLQVRPEFVAQIAGYIHSAQRKQGLHALADIGGGTLDLVTFIVHEKDEESVFPFLVPEVCVLGTQMLNQNRLVDAPPCDDVSLPDELQPVLNPREYAEVSGISEEQVRQRDEIFWETVRGLVQNVFYRTKQKRYRLSPAWTGGLPTFLTGGGGKVDGYATSLQSGGQHSARTVNLIPLPPHPRLANFSGESDDYQRISVACGLALDAFSLGQIVPAKDVEDDVADPKRPKERPDRDDLYPH
ncbi:hypothetical protein CNECB9_2200028 [Cupriavidus necator]|uniref:Actin-like ATPase domain-containing protein n=1 Tax=Cupriavidus necator TaxID=106590 RepID=A0A1K0J7L1_CUPNE|nr:hypothetical protein CNECB9_2200028 [Cupriavidus necator]